MKGSREQSSGESELQADDSGLQGVPSGVVRVNHKNHVMRESFLDTHPTLRTYRSHIMALSGKTFPRHHVSWGGGGGKQQPASQRRRRRSEERGNRRSEPPPRRGSKPEISCGCKRGTSSSR